MTHPIYCWEKKHRKVELCNQDERLYYRVVDIATKELLRQEVLPSIPSLDLTDASLKKCQPILHKNNFVTFEETVVGVHSLSVDRFHADAEEIARGKEIRYQVETRAVCINEKRDFFLRTHLGFTGRSDNNETIPLPPEIHDQRELLQTELVVQEDGTLKIQRAVSAFDDQIPINQEDWVVNVIDSGTSGSNPTSWGGHAKLILERIEPVQRSVREGQVQGIFFAHVVEAMHLYHESGAEEDRAIIKKQPFDVHLKPILHRILTQPITRLQGENILASVIDDQYAQQRHPPRFYFRYPGRIGVLCKLTALPLVALLGGLGFAIVTPLTTLISCVCMQVQRRSLYDNVLDGVGIAAGLASDSEDEQVNTSICSENCNQDGCYRHPLQKWLFQQLVLNPINAVWPLGKRHNCMSWVLEKLAAANIVLTQPVSGIVAELPRSFWKREFCNPIKRKI